ncbi:MAG: hypothetical protein SGPRY_014033, partial [Prymnesium sp.]
STLLFGMASPPPALAWGNSHLRSSGFPSLQELALRRLAAAPDLLQDLRGLDQHLAVSLLKRLFQSAKLDYRLACVFRDAGHPEITEVINSLDLVAAVPTYNLVRSCRKL